MAPMNEKSKVYVPSTTWGTTACSTDFIILLLINLKHLIIVFMVVLHVLNQEYMNTPTKASGTI